jgi:hypothetical protein
MCAGLLYRVPPWLLCVLDFNTKSDLDCIDLTIYAEYHLGCYVCWIFMESDVLVCYMY